MPTSQELKSQQEQLPDAVAQLLMQHGWVSANTPQQQDAAAQAAAPCTVGSAPARQHPSGETSAFEGPGSGTHQPSAHPHFQVPGITITSFHLQQLVRSLQVGAAGEVLDSWCGLPSHSTIWGWTCHCCCCCSQLIHNTVTAPLPRTAKPQLLPQIFIPTCSCSRAWCTPYTPVRRCTPGPVSSQFH